MSTAVWAKDGFIAEACAAYLRSIGRQAQAVPSPRGGFGCLLLAATCPEDVEDLELSHIKGPLALVEIDVNAWDESCGLLAAAAALDRH